MPHQIIEYSQNLAERLDIDELIDVMHSAAAKIDALPIGGLRTRGVPRERYRIADGHADNAFISVLLRIAPGRPPEVRKSAGEALFATLCDYLEPTFGSSPLSIAYEIQELDADMRWKRSNIRDYMAERQGEN